MNMANKTVPLDPKIADRLLDLLGDSDKFRELFEQDPAAALEMIGYVAPAQTIALSTGPSAGASIADCMQVKELASKEAIRNARKALRTMLLSGLSQITPNLDATYSE